MSNKHLVRWSARGYCPMCGARLTTRATPVSATSGGNRLTYCQNCGYVSSQQVIPPYKPF